MLISTSTGICSLVRHRPEMYYSCEESLRAVAEAGFPAVDMCFVAYGRPGKPMAEPNWRDWVKKQKALADELGLITNQGHAHYYTREDSYRFTPGEWEEAQGLIRRDIEAAGICGIPWLVVHPDTYLENGNYSRKKSLRLERERFLRFGDLASRFHVGLAIENMIDNRPAKRFAGSHEDLLELLDLLGDDELFGICWDTGHANLNQLDQPAAIRAMGGRLRALHVNDNLGQKDNHTLPFLGTVEWPPIMEALRDGGYQGDFTYEIHRFTDGFTPEIHQRAVRFAYEVAEYMLTLAQ